jgi:hypothetical protein
MLCSSEHIGRKVPYLSTMFIFRSAFADVVSREAGMRVLRRAKSGAWLGSIGMALQEFCEAVVLGLIAREYQCRIDPVARLRRIGGL